MRLSNSAVMAAACAACAITTVASAGLTGYRFTLTELNDSGVRGGGVITIDDDHTLTLQFIAFGLESHRNHAQSFHGLGNPNPLNQTMFDDLDFNGFITSDEGETIYGSSVMPLTWPQTPTNDAPNHDDFPLATGGIINFLHTYTFDMNNADDALLFTELQSMDGRALVLHGLSVDLDGDGFSSYESTLPVAIGVMTAIIPAPGALALLVLPACLGTRRRRRHG